MKDNKKIRKISVCTLVNIITILLFFILEILSPTIFRDQLVNALICRVLARGILGLLLLYNAGYLLFTKGTGFIWIYFRPKNRSFSGVLLGLVGAYLVVTAIMGHGANTDPTLIWWRAIK